jgi:hypothetical protein
MSSLSRIFGVLGGEVTLMLVGGSFALAYLVLC